MNKKIPEFRNIIKIALFPSSFLVLVPGGEDRQNRRQAGMNIGTAFIERSNDSQWRELRNRRLALRQSRVSLEFVPRKGRGRRAKKSRERVSACLLPPSYETRVSHYPIAWDLSFSRDHFPDSRQYAVFEFPSPSFEIDVSICQNRRSNVIDVR